MEATGLRLLGVLGVRGTAVRQQPGLDRRELRLQPLAFLALPLRQLHLLHEYSEYPHVITQSDPCEYPL